MTGIKKSSRWSAEDDARLLEMRSAGASLDSIADLLGRSVGAVSDRYWLARRRRGFTRPAPKAVIVKKKCSTCKRPFTPRWPTNYRCRGCKKKYENTSPFEPGGGDSGRRIRRT